MEYGQVFRIFEANADAEKANAMSAYMRGKFPYLGIQAPKRKAISKDLLKAAKKEKVVDWDFVRKCWEKDEREFQYLAVDYLDAMKDSMTSADIPAFREIAVRKSWWDTIDGLDRIAGRIALNFPEVNETMIAWSVDDNIWLRRIAIDHQLLRKEKTDTALLEAIIENNFGQKEFFINKAIGWSLRDYSKTNPEWVRAFVEKHRNKLAPLSIKEASKYNRNGNVTSDNKRNKFNQKDKS
jgi:3-methyladenine DNA glycosylase AlkD